MKKEITTDNAPAAPGLLSQAVLESAKYRLEISGQIGIDPSLGKMVEGGIEAETTQALKNVESILREVGWTLEHVVRVRIFLVDMDDYATVNEIYTNTFSGVMPARTAMVVKELPLGAQIEIECLAAGDDAAY